MAHNQHLNLPKTPSENRIFYNSDMMAGIQANLARFGYGKNKTLTEYPYLDAAGAIVPVHLQQGSVDGACVVYTLLMNFLLINYITQEQIYIDHKFDRRNPKEKFLSHLMNDQGFIRDGYLYKRLKKEIEEYCKDLSVEYIDPAKFSRIGERIDIIEDYIAEDIPVIISVSWFNGAHALLAIGIEKREGKVTKIYCLDPGAPMPNVSMWNCYIDTSNRRGKYCCEYFDSLFESLDTIRRVKLDDALIVNYKNIDK